MKIIPKCKIRNEFKISPGFPLIRSYNINSVIIIQW